jgi:hypothetical protein
MHRSIKVMVGTFGAMVIAFAGFDLGTYLESERRDEVEKQNKESLDLAIQEGLRHRQSMLAKQSVAENKIADCEAQLLIIKVWGSEATKGNANALPADYCKTHSKEEMIFATMPKGSQ